MDNIPKNKAEEQARRTAERVTERSKEGFERITAVSGETAETMRDSYSKALKGAQDYQNRLIEFTQTNADRSFELAHRLLSAKSPSELVEVSSDHLRRQWEIMADQAKQLAELTQNVTLATAEPLKAGLEKVFNRAA